MLSFTIENTVKHAVLKIVQSRVSVQLNSLFIVSLIYCGGIK